MKTRTILLSDIKIKNNFKRFKPNEDKLNKVRDHFDMYGTVDKNIIISEDGYLIDGYIRYLVLQENHVGVIICEVAPITISKPKPRTYVYGYHQGNPTKEYVWVLRGNKVSNVEVGDLISVGTKYGRKSVVVSKTETLTTQPVNRKINRVLGIIKKKDELNHETDC